MSDDILVRIPLSGTSQFHPLALAPGLPMLDARKLTYQVLLGWFGDVLAEPELENDGVLFFAQHEGRRQKIVERSLATAQDLNGQLSQEFERLKKALFEVKPVSPSERLIFNRLQPPIGNHDGYLYKVRTEGGDPRLVWCWGFQRRSSDAPAVLCSNPECALITLRQDPLLTQCPQCDEPFEQKRISLGAERRSRIPIGAAAATVILACLAAATYMFPVFTGADESGELPEFSPGDGPVSEVETAVTNPRQETPEEQPEEVPERPDQPSTVDTKPVNESSEQPREDPEAESKTAVAVTPPPEKETKEDSQPSEPVSKLDWHRDYLTAYEASLESKKRLAILFFDPSSDRPHELPPAELDEALETVARLRIPLDETLEDGSRLIEHRSFRHLGGKPGIVLIDLADPQSPLFGQAVSAMPLPAGGAFPSEPLRRMLSLPAGSVGQRTLLLAIRDAGTETADSSLLNASPHETLNDLANRNSRYMAHFGRNELYEPEHRAEVIRLTFGDEPVVRELTFASESAISIHMAARDAAQRWVQESTSIDSQDEPSRSYGLDLFQSPETGRWFATLILVR